MQKATKPTNENKCNSKNMHISSHGAAVIFCMKTVEQISKPLYFLSFLPFLNEVKLL